MIIQADARHIPLLDDCVQCVVTSPPYWGLRKYAGNQELVWEVSEQCQHEWVNGVKHRSSGGPQVAQTKWESNTAVVDGQRDTVHGTCSKCGAWRGAFGLERHIDCGQMFMELKPELPIAEREYVHRRLLAEGLHDADSCGTERRVSRRFGWNSVAQDTDPMPSGGGPEVSPHASDNPDKYSHRVLEPNLGSGHTEAICSPCCEQGCDRLSNADGSDHEVGSDVSGRVQVNGEPLGLLPADERETVSYPSMREQSFASSDQNMLSLNSSAFPGEKMKSSGEPQSTSPDCREGFSKSVGMSESKTSLPFRDMDYHTGCSCESRFLAQSILPQDLLKFYRKKLCSSCYVCHSIEILREVRRILRPDGVCFWNLGDSYNAHSGQRTERDKAGYKQATDRGSCEAASRNDTKLKAKDLCLIPARVAIAAQEDGWWVRSDIIWAKPNPMPESVRDRPTDAYEHILMLTKSARYYWNAEAVAEPVTQSTLLRLGEPNLADQHGSDRVLGKSNGPMKAVPPRFGGSKYGDSEQEEHRTKSGNSYELGSGRRNLRNLWEFPTAPYTGAHFATFPPELVIRCLQAATKPCDLVLDPFAGSGTVGEVAFNMGRRFVLCDLAYQDLQRERIPALYHSGMSVAALGS